MQLNGLPSQNAFKEKRDKVQKAVTIHHNRPSMCHFKSKRTSKSTKQEMLAVIAKRTKVATLEICHIYPQATSRRFHVRLPFYPPTWRLTKP
jgi:hypothetical protein